MASEFERLQENDTDDEPWYRWGPYLSDRQWGTVREDYSADGNAWNYFSHDLARSRTYRWGEDGLGGFCDRKGEVCFALALWNGRDPIFKERLFGLTNGEGNHGEDVKEYYFYLDNTPTHSYMRWLYKYPQSPYPYTQLINENRQRNKYEPEYELLDTGIFDDDAYFDVEAEYAKLTPDDICLRLTISNRSQQTASIDVLPTLWLRNTWTWYDKQPTALLSKLKQDTIKLTGWQQGDRWLYCQSPNELLFTDNETNKQRSFNIPNTAKYVKDAFHDWVIYRKSEAINPKAQGTKAAARYHLEIPSHQTQVIFLRFTDKELDSPFDDNFTNIFTLRQQEADAYYDTLTPNLDSDQRSVQRQAFAGLLWSKQFYSYDVCTWLKGDRNEPPPPSQRWQGRNADWYALDAEEIISMPDKWEYPWFAAWDLAFHCVTFALMDAKFAKRQLLLLARDRYMNPNGQLPAYEWSFSDVNPPVQAWAAWRVYKIEQKRTGKGDREFLERIFQKLMLNFIWWVNRKDPQGANLFQGGFLGLDNIGVFDRSKPLPMGGYLQQADGTAWMGMYALNMLAIALELSREDKVYADMALKFFEHFLYIANAINHVGQAQIALWDEEDGFYYDALVLPDGNNTLMKVHSIAGLTPLLAVDTIEPDLLKIVPGLEAQMEWFLNNRTELAANIASVTLLGQGKRRLLSLTNAEQLKRILSRLLDEKEFLSPYGIRSVSRYHQDHPFVFRWDGTAYKVDYEPAESTTDQFGGNSNWRGPIWYPLNFLIIEALQKFHHYFGDDFTVECPTGSGRYMNLWAVSMELSQRLINIFLRDQSDRRPVYGDKPKFQNDPYWRDLILFHEYFHGDQGEGLGASHQTGWTALVAKLIQQVNDCSA